MSQQYIVIPGGVANSYRKRYNTFWALDPIKLHNRNAYALPVAVLDEPAFEGVKPDLETFGIETLAIEAFAWWHTSQL
jgi:hypothetical protein